VVGRSRPAFYLILGILFTASGCVGNLEDVDLISAHIVRKAHSENYVVTVSLRGDDIFSLASQEIYPHLVVTECNNENIRFPSSPTLGNVRLDDFRAILNSLNRNGVSRDYEIQGDIPHIFLQRISSACVKLEGGSYMGRSLRSNQLRIERMGVE
jgi:hypothetical protein